MQQLFLAFVRFRMVLIALGLVSLAGAPADAALRKYGLNVQTLLQYANTSPKTEYNNTGEQGLALVDDSGANPVLNKLLIGDVAGGASLTVIVPGLTGFIWVSGKEIEGPSNNQIGTGSAASSINWGNLDGWTTTGGAYCHAIPSLICLLGSRIEQETISPPLESASFDMGRWVFHGTGFLHVDGFIERTSTDNVGNQQWFLRGEKRTDGTVPALPLLGIGAVGIAVIAMGVGAIRRRS